MGIRIDVEKYNMSRVGLIDLPTIANTTLPAFCSDFAYICALESSQQYEQSFAMYEERYRICALHGWTLDGSGHGNDASVGFLTTPCGTRVAVKGTQKERVLEHVQRECAVLKELGEDNSTAACPGCFPRWVPL